MLLINLNGYSKVKIIIFLYKISENQDNIPGKMRVTSKRMKIEIIPVCSTGKRFCNVSLESNLKIFIKALYF